VAECRTGSTVADDGSTGTTPKVLWVTPTLSSAFGGPTSTAVNGVIAEKMCGLPTVIATTVHPDGIRDSAPARDRLSSAGVATRVFPRVGRFSSSETWGLSSGMAVWLLRKVRSFDVIHLQYVWCMSSLIGCFAAKLAGVPVVVTPHESLTDYDIEVASRSRPKRLLKMLLRQFYLRTVDRIVFMSELEKHDTFTADRETVLISHAVCERSVPPDRKAATGAEGPLRIGFLGRNIPKKGIDRLIRSLGREPDRNWQLLIAGPPGSPEFREEQDRLSDELGVADRVSWLGFLDSRSSLFEQCDVLAMPSAYEGFGMVSAEAMSHGVPVIVPRQSGVAEIVSEYAAGQVIEEPDTDHLFEALKRFDSARDMWLEFSKNGIRAVDERLTYAAYASAVTRLYRSLP
jgi:glycosyltransferase involved in cell wall biosynthesis